MAVIDCDALGTANSCRAIIDLVVVVVYLRGRVYSFILAIVCIVMQENNNGSSLRLDLGSSINEFHGRHGVMINSNHVDFASWEGRTLHDSIVTDDKHTTSPVDYLHFRPYLGWFWISFHGRLSATTA